MERVNVNKMPYQGYGSAVREETPEERHQRLKSTIQTLYWKNYGDKADARIDVILEVLFYLMDPCCTSTLTRPNSKVATGAAMGGGGRYYVGTPDPISTFKEKLEAYPDTETPKVMSYSDLVEEVRKTKNALEHEKKWSAMFRDRATKAEQTVFDVRKLVE